MPLSITVRLRGGGYDAGGERPSEAEWPPHPARVFCALAASARTEAEWDALRWLEEQGPPQVWADRLDQVHRGRVHGYVVQNAVSPKGGNQNWPGRTNGSRERSFVVPSRDWFAIVWTSADPPPDVGDLLGTLAWRVPYIGRSTSRAEVSIRCSLPIKADDGVVYGPAGAGGGFRDLGLRIPYPGYTNALRRAYSTGARSWEVAKTRPYCEIREVQGEQNMTAAAPAQGPFDELLVWTIERPVARIGGEQVVALASSLRRTVMARVPDPIPAQVSGHTEPGRQHVAFLALPDVGHRHADGHVLGLALAIPCDLPPADLAVLLKALVVEPALTRIGISRGRALAVRYGADKAGLRPARWSASNRNGGHEWVTTTPMMLDGHTRRGRDEADEVARALVIAGYPRPVDVEVSGGPMVSGGIWRPHPRTMPQGRPHRQLVHARVRFGDYVIGPVLAGSMRYLGLGLFQPVAQNGKRDRDSAQVLAGVW